MTNEQVNRTLAEWMEAKVLDNGCCSPYPKELPFWAKRLLDFDTLKIGGYGYTTSFDWFMPCWVKFRDMYRRMDGNIVGEYLQHQLEIEKSILGNNTPEPAARLLAAAIIDLKLNEK